MLVCGVSDRAVLKLDKVGAFISHIDHDVAGEAVAGIYQPLDYVGVLERHDPVGLALIVYLGILGGDGEL